MIFGKVLSNFVKPLLLRLFNINLIGTFNTY